MSLTQSYLFVPIAAETTGAIKQDAIDFLRVIGRRITHNTDDHRASAFLFQRLPVLVQRYNAVSVLGTFNSPTQLPKTKCSRSSRSCYLSLSPQDLYYRWQKSYKKIITIIISWISEIYRMKEKQVLKTIKKRTQIQC